MVFLIQNFLLFFHFKYKIKFTVDLGIHPIIFDFTSNKMEGEKTTEEIKETIKKVENEDLNTQIKPKYQIYIVRQKNI